MKVSIDDLDPKDLLFTRTYEVKIEMFKIKHNKSLVVAITVNGFTQYTECFNTDEVDCAVNGILDLTNTVQDTHYVHLLLAVDYYFKKVNK